MTDEQIDHKIATNIMGWEPVEYEHEHEFVGLFWKVGPDGSLTSRLQWRPSRDLNQAMEAVEAKRCMLTCGKWKENWYAHIGLEGAEVLEDTLARAICLALLEANKMRRGNDAG